MWLIVGLGNPGNEYAHTRHNIGFMVADELARRFGKANAWRSKFGGEVIQVNAEAVPRQRQPEGASLVNQTILLKPQEFMNVSGEATQRTAAFYKIEVGQVIIVHDEIDLEFGTLRVKVGGGHGGHNGLRSMSQQLGEGYLRVRCGVGKPAHKGEAKEKVVGHVLGGFNKEEQKELPFLVNEAADAVAAIMNNGATAAMNKVNGSRIVRE